ncbi:MAG: twin-arginine translocase subunit TatC [Planctomycetia bacterium]|nr:twin-arginine translocase subunit TatC [Planctomycetia bacterium]
MSMIEEDDLFKDSTMSFGDHLEELRGCLYRSFYGLLVGFLIGLCFGGMVIKIIQTPLTEALTKYYKTRSKDQIQGHLDEFYKRGYGKDVALLPSQRGLIQEKLVINPEELAVLLGLDPATLPQAQPFSPNPTPLENISDETSWHLADYFSFKKWGEWWNSGNTPWNSLEGINENVEETVLEENRNAAKKSVKEQTPLVEIYAWRAVSEDPRVQTKGLTAQEPFMIYLKASLLVGVLIASPWIFWQIWSFIAAGLYPHEKKYVHIFLPFSLALFLGGAALAFFFVFQPVLEFLFQFNDWMGIAPEPRISDWLGFFLILPIGFGISFQLPLVMLFLERIGIMSTQLYASHWRVAILIIFVISMFLTPADPTSLILMAGPLSILYIGGIFLCKIMPRIKNPYVDEMS